MTTTPAVIPPKERPTKLHMSIHTGMLESLGINMYTSVGKSLVEFIANGFDADAEKVEINIPFEDISRKREELRTTAKKEVAEGKREPFQSLYDPLPDDIKIVISDNGHGMTPDEIEEKFLFVNRNRRKDSGSIKSESGKRFVMGRKGLGKLAGFGTAEKIEIWTKRSGEAFSTKFVMDFNDIKKHEAIQNVEFTPIYKDENDLELKGTTITLSGLRCDSLKSQPEIIVQTISQNFAFNLTEKFNIFVNTKKIEEPDVEYEYIYPDEIERNKDGYGEHAVKVDDVYSYNILTYF